MKKCKCGCEKVHLQPKYDGEDVWLAQLVSIKCDNCNKFLGWCPREKRAEYMGVPNPYETGEKALPKTQPVLSKVEMIKQLQNAQQIVNESFKFEKQKATYIINNLMRYVNSAVAYENTIVEPKGTAEE